MPSQLFSPINLGPVEIGNRLAVAPMCMYSGVDGCATDWHLQHLGQLGYSGAGLVMVEASAVERRGRISHGCLGLYSDDNEAAMAQVLARVQRIAGDTVFGVQLAHAGRKGSCHPPWLGGKPLADGEDPWQTVSAVADPFDEGWHSPLALGREELPALVDAYVQAALRAVRIGFRVLEIHCAHGYLLHQFLSPLCNTRDDEFGGPLHQRMAFPLAVIRGVRQALPGDVALGIRVSATDWLDGGWDIDDSIAFVNAARDSIHYCCVSSAGIAARSPIVIKPGFQVPFAAQIRKATGVVTRAVGLIADPRQAEGILARGEADQIALARAFLDDPRWGWRAADMLGEKAHFPAPYHMVRGKSWLKLRDEINSEFTP